MDWVLNRDDGKPDVMWAFEFYRDDASFDRQIIGRAYAHGNDIGYRALADPIDLGLFDRPLWSWPSP